MTTHQIETVRRFNRTWTQRIGVLEDSFLGSGRALAPSRLLFEIGPQGAAVSLLRARLGFDSGYLSRLLRHLESEGLVEVRADTDDARRRTARLTAAGHDTWRELDERSDDLARELVAGLPDRLQARLTEALATAERITRSTTLELGSVDPAGTAAQHAVGAYFAELADRFPEGFDAGTAATSDVPAMSPPDGVFVVADAGGEPVACGGVQRLDADTGEIKRMWVHPEWRGLGLGARMLRHLEEETRRLGCRRVRLDTNATLEEAISMYTAAGYRGIERYNDNPYAQRWFEKPL